MIRMIASDLDGTLLRKDWSISEYTIKIIKEAQASGIRWVTVTGRSDRGARPIMENYGLSCDYILMNGAEFRDTNGNLIKSENIDTDLARFVCEKLHRENLGFEINTDRGDYTTTMELAEYSDYLEDGYEKLFEEKHNIRKILVFCDDIPKIIDFNSHVAFHLYLATQTPVVLDLLTAEVRYFGRQNLTSAFYNLAFALSA